MRQITRKRQDCIEWVNEVDPFLKPETFIDYLLRYAPEGSYRVEGCNVWATDEAIEAAVEGIVSEAEDYGYRNCAW